jgi:mono/diheme cytochrome c family protein
MYAFDHDRGDLERGACVRCGCGIGAGAPITAHGPIVLGQRSLQSYCAACHDTSAHGDGPLAANMKKPPPDLTQIAARNGGTFPAALVAQIIDGRQPVKGHGGSDMPVWGDAFKASRLGSSEESIQARIQALVEYLERLQERGGQ